MAIEIIYGDSIPPVLRSKISAWYVKNMPNNHYLESSDTLRTFDAGTISGVLSAIISVIMFVNQFWERKAWTAEKLLSATADELIKYGVFDFEIEEVKNFDALTDSSNNAACAVTVVDNKKNTRHVVLLYRKGDSIVVDLEGR